MAWFKIDDTLAFNAKVLQAGNEAVGLWVRAGSWCASQLSDGVIPKPVVAAMAMGEANAEAIASRLLQAGLWNESDDGSSYVFHDWSEYQPSAAEVRSKRAEVSRKRAEAGRRGGVKSGLTRRNAEDSRGSKTEANSEANGEAKPKQNEAPSRPVPSRPTKEQETTSPVGRTASAEALERGKRGTRLPPDFVPSEKVRDMIRGEHPHVDLAYEHRKFVDHWTATPGQKGVKLDWDATWRNWMRRAGERNPPRQRQQSQPTPNRLQRQIAAAGITPPGMNPAPPLDIIRGELT
ncbi:MULTISPECIES: hypothetical protein [unclassified Luteococcus]|uniref:hypothetical protein n=1 Tax=unclassified Luteococcus TaxID=2639923 RepID=UPI00313D52E2